MGGKSSKVEKYKEKEPTAKQRINIALKKTVFKRGSDKAGNYDPLPVPRHVKALKKRGAQWFTDALRHGHVLGETQRVTKVEYAALTEGGKGVLSDITGVTLTYDADGKDVKGPTRFVVKTAPVDLMSHVTCGAFELCESEAVFYNDVMPEAVFTFPLPQHFYCNYARANNCVVLVIENVNDLPGGVTWLLEETPTTMHVATQAAGVLASIHGQFWHEHEKATPGKWFHKIHMMESWYYQLAFEFAAKNVKKFDTWVVKQDEVKALFTSDLRQAMHEFIKDGYESWALPCVKSGWSTLNHGDFRLSNTYFHDDKMGVIDWQLMFYGSAFMDIAWLVYTSFSEAFTRESYDAFIAHYWTAVQEQPRAKGTNLLDNLSEEELNEMVRLSLIQAILKQGYIGCANKAADIAKNADVRKTMLGLLKRGLTNTAILGSVEMWQKWKRGETLLQLRMAEEAKSGGGGGRRSSQIATGS